MWIFTMPRTITYESKSMETNERIVVHSDFELCSPKRGMNDYIVYTITCKNA